MARAGRSGPGYASLIIFIVLCLALIGAYVPLAMAFAKRANTLEQLQQSIKRNLDGVGQALNVQGDWSRVDQGEAAYDDRFFKAIKEAAEKGVKAERMVKLLGIGGDDPAQTMIDFVNNEVESSEGAEGAKTLLDPEAEHDVKWYVLEKKKEISNREQRRQKAHQSEQRWQEEARRAGQTLQQAEAAHRAKSDQYVADTARSKDDYKKKVDEYVARWRKANEVMEDRSNELQAAKKDFEQERKALGKKVSDIEAEVASLKAELAKKKPKPVVITRGKVLKAEALEQLAFIDLGRANGIEVGERFLVMRPTLGGEYVQKGVLKVIGVDETISRADIIEQDEKHLVMKDDVIYREKRFQEQ